MSNNLNSETSLSKFFKKNGETIELVVVVGIIALSYFFGLIYLAIGFVGLGILTIVYTLLSKDNTLGIGIFLGSLMTVFGLILVGITYI